MAYEATKVELTNNTGFPRRFTCADGVAIAKGALLKMTDPRTAALADGVADPIAGIASMDKEASDGSTSISVYTDGIFEMKASGAITIGAPVVSSSTANHVSMVSGIGIASGAAVIGYAMEAAADAEVINVRVRV